jgi:hypothetical protein
MRGGSDSWRERVRLRNRKKGGDDRGGWAERRIEERLRGKFGGGKGIKRKRIERKEGWGRGRPREEGLR